MQLTLNQTEITTAITDYIRSAVTVSDSMEIRIDMKATRGDAGFSAIVDIVPAGTPVASSLEIANKVTRARKVKADQAQETGTGEANTAEAGEAQAEEEEPVGDASEAVVEEDEQPFETQPEEPVAEEKPAVAAKPAAVAVKPASTVTPVNKTATAAPVAGARPSLFAGLAKKTAA